MADFTSDLQSFRSSFPFVDIDPAIEPINQFSEINQTNLNSFQGFLPFSNDNFLGQQTVPEFPGNLAENFPGIFQHNINNRNSNVDVPSASYQAIPSVTNYNDPSDSKKRKAVDVVSESSSMNSSPQVSRSGIKRKNVSKLSLLGL